MAVNLMPSSNKDNVQAYGVCNINPKYSNSKNVHVQQVVSTSCCCKKMPLQFQNMFHSTLLAPDSSNGMHRGERGLEGPRCNLSLWQHRPYSVCCFGLLLPGALDPSHFRKTSVASISIEAKCSKICCCHVVTSKVCRMAQGFLGGGHNDSDVIQDEIVLGR